MTNPENTVEDMTTHYVGKIIAFENDELDEDEMCKLFQFLVDSGIVYHLQGSYQRIAEQLLEEGLISDNGIADNIL